jgi:hypothetical protein
LTASEDLPTPFGATYVSLLPPHWGTLYELAQLPEKTLKAKLKDGTITAETERKQVRALVTKSNTAAESEHVRTRSAKTKEQAEPTSEPTQVVIEPTPPMPTHDQLLAMVEAALAGDTGFQARVEALPSWRSSITARPVAETDDDADVEEIIQAAANKFGDRPQQPTAPATRVERPLNDDITNPSSIIPEDDERREYEQELYDRWGD